MPAAGGASRAPRLCARRRMRGRGGWAWGRASGRAVPHGAVCSRVSPPSSVVQVHVCSALCRARGVETVAAAGSWVGSWASTRVYSWSRSLYCAVSDTVLAPRSGGRGHRRACAPEPPLPTIPHSPVFCSMGCFERLLDPLTLSLLCARLVSLALGLVFVNARCCANPIARRLVVPAPFPLSRLPSRPCVSRAREARARGLLALILSCSAGRPPRRAWHGKARSHAPDFSL